jgi:hypothetical protein
MDLIMSCNAVKMEKEIEKIIKLLGMNTKDKEFLGGFWMGFIVGVFSSLFAVVLAWNLINLL